LCDLLMVVTTNELPAIHATQNALAYLEEAGVDRGKFRPIVNRYNTDIGLDQPTIEAALDFPVYHLLPSDYESIQKALLEGRAVPTHTKIGDGFAQLAQRLTGRRPAPTKKPSLLSGLFSPRSDREVGWLTRAHRAGMPAPPPPAAIMFHCSSFGEIRHPLIWRRAGTIRGPCA
jgi:Flp pilus assembly CpaE family ATPase